MWKFDDTEIEDVITAKYNKSNATIELECFSQGNAGFEVIGQIVNEFARLCYYIGEKINMPAVTINLESADDRVFAVGDLDDLDKLFGTDEVLIFETNKGMIRKQYSVDATSGCFPAGPIEITPILNIGSNTVSIRVEDYWGLFIGSDDIYLIKTTGKDPRTVIESWREKECDEASNPLTLWGHRILQTTGGQAYELTDGFEKWNAVLDSVEFTEEDRANTLIFYTLRFLTGNSVFKDEYGKCYGFNMTYGNLLSRPDYINGGGRSQQLSELIGEVGIREQYPINEIDIYGGGIGLPSWIEVNGVRKYWHYPLREATEKLSWELGGVTDVIIKSPNNAGEKDVNGYYGTHLKGICLDLVPDTMGIGVDEEPPYLPPTNGGGPVTPPTPADISSKIYYAPFTRFNNMQYWRWTNRSSAVPSDLINIFGAVDGHEMGEVLFGETKTVNKVEVGASGCVKPVNISVNEVTKPMTKFHDSEPKGDEKMEFKINPTKAINIKTSKHEICRDNWSACDHGANVSWIKVYYGSVNLK